MQKRISFILSILWIATSCHQSSHQKFVVLVSDTSKTLFHFDELDFIKKKSELLHLPEICNGVDSFELRIWYSGFGMGTKLINLRNVGTKWICYETKYFSSERLLDSSFTRSIPAPKDLNQIVRYFTSDSILNLPSQRAIPGFRDNIGDGQRCQIEIATNSFYKLLDYHCPEHYTDTDNRKFLQTLLLLDKYFNFYFPWCKVSP